ncbi:MAG TPA: ABC transporter substrate-binding protein, partial [Caldilineaceae bacterium]|nr:ABC transporter substrate-binding protein [Caldilineaceae bacterium]
METRQAFSRREFLRLAGVMTGATALAACTPGSAPGGQAEGGAAPAADEKVTVVYWHGWSGRFAEWLDRVSAEFEKANPDINVEFVQIDWGELYTKLLTSVAAGDPPDTYVAGNESGQLYSLAA